MPRLEQQPVATTTVTEQVTLTPRQRTKLLTQLKAYAALVDQIKGLEQAKAKAKGAVEAVLGEIGETNLTVDGYKTTLVCAKGSIKLDEKKLVTLGVSMDIIEQAKVQGPDKKPYVLITTPEEA